MSEIMVEFLLLADEWLPTDDIVKEIGLPCTEHYGKGDVFFFVCDNTTERYRKESCVLYSTGYIKTIDVEAVLDIIYELIYPKRQTIVNVMKKYNMKACFCIVLNLTSNIILGISEKMVHLASYFNADFDFDTYVDIDSTITVEIPD